MNHLPNSFPAREAEDRPSTRRAQAKLATRERVLQAAKRLFISRGYEAATIRDIAAESGMSTGAVFANFTDKTDLFHAVLEADHDKQVARVKDAMQHHTGSVESALGLLFSTGYQIHLDQLPLLQASAGLSWTEGLEGQFGERPNGRWVLEMVVDLLDRAVEHKELSGDVDKRLLAEMLWDVYLANYRLALFDHWTLEQLDTRFARQIDILLAGSKL